MNSGNFPAFQLEAPGCKVTSSSLVGTVSSIAWETEIINIP